MMKGLRSQTVSKLNLDTFEKQIQHSVANADVIAQTSLIRFFVGNGPRFSSLPLSFHFISNCLFLHIRINKTP